MGKTANKLSNPVDDSKEPQRSSSVEAVKEAHMQVAAAVEKIRQKESVCNLLEGLDDFKTEHEQGLNALRHDVNSLFLMIKADPLCADAISHYPEFLLRRNEDNIPIAAVAAQSSQSAAAMIANEYPAMLKLDAKPYQTIEDVIEKLYPDLWGVMWEAKRRLSLDREGEEEAIQRLYLFKTEARF